MSPRQDNDHFSNEEHSFVSDIVNFCRHIMRAAEGMSPEQGSSLSAEASMLITELHELMNVRLQSMNSETPGEDEAWESIETTRHRLGTIIGLNEAVEAANPFAILGIAAFALLEVHEGPFGEWQRHLQGARSLLDHHCRTPEALTKLSVTVTGLVRIVYQLVWLDTLGALARGTTGLIFDDWHRDMLDAEYLLTMACEPDTFALFNAVAKGEMVLDPLNGAMLALDQLAKIDNDTSQRGLATNVNRYGATLAALARLPDTALPSRQSALSSTVERMCLAIDAMEATSQFYIHVTVPVYLAGMFAETNRQCEAVRTYYTNCRITGGRYLDALPKCTARWRDIGLG